MKKQTQIWVLVNVSILSALLLFGLFVMTFRKLGIVGCSLNQLTGLYCPGCGGTRALESLLSLKIVDSLKYNPAIMLGLPIFLYYDIRWYFAAKRNMANEYFNECKFISLIILISFMFVFFFVRNILLLCGIDMMLL